MSNLEKARSKKWATGQRSKRSLQFTSYT